MLKRILLGLSLLLAPAAASAQALTSGCSNPPPNYGVVWSSGQWIACLSSFQAYLGYTPLNVAGGSMSGQLFLQPSVTTNAPLNFPPGSAPSSPNNGDVWFTSAGMFLQANGVTVGPLAGTTSPTLNNPTLTGTVTMPDLSTFTSAGGQGFAHLYVNLTSDAGGAQKLQVSGNSYVSGGFSVGTTTAPGTGDILATGGLSIGAATAQSGGLAINNATSAALASASFLDFSTNLRLFSTGATSSTYSGVTLSQYHSDLTGARTATILDTSGNTQLPGTVSLGSSSTDFAEAQGGSSGATITTNGGTLTVGSAGGTTNLPDTTVALTASGYHNCTSIGTGSGGAIVCGGTPSGYITYNDNITSNTLAVSGNLYAMNTSSGSLTLTLPSSPGNGAYVAFFDAGGNFAIHSLIIANNGSNLMYVAGNMTVNTAYFGAVLRYSSGQSSWIFSPL